MIFNGNSQLHLRVTVSFSHHLIPPKAPEDHFKNDSLLYDLLMHQNEALFFLFFLFFGKATI